MIYYHLFSQIKNDPSSTLKRLATHIFFMRGLNRAQCDCYEYHSEILVY